MGLKIVEIILEVEDRFAVRIPDAQAQGVVTAGDLYCLVCSLAGRRLPDPEAWLELRDIVARMTGQNPDCVGADTRLSDFD